MVATTINMHKDTLAKITNAAVRQKKSRHEIIIILLKRLLNDHEKIKHRFISIKYQSDDSSMMWHCFHIRFRPDEYEFFIDLRKLCKCSVSLLIAIAVNRYNNDLNTNDNKTVDKYQQFNKYILRKRFVDGIISWHIFWMDTKKHPPALMMPPGPHHSE